MLMAQPSTIIELFGRNPQRDNWFEYDIKGGKVELEQDDDGDVATIVMSYARRVGEMVMMKRMDKMTIVLFFSS